MKQIKSILLISLLSIISCTTVESNKTTISNDKVNEISIKNIDTNKIQVLNFGTFHMGYTSDASSVNFDERNKKNQQDVHDVAKKIANFNPTVIVVETPPYYDSTLNEVYLEYLKNPEMVFKYPTEIELLGYEVGRLCGVEKIYGIDHKMGYNYRIGFDIVNTIDSTMYNEFFKAPFSYFPSIIENEDSLSLYEKLVQTNSKAYLDFSMVINSEILTHAGTDDGFEGADEAAKFYQRNLRMYSNLNRIKLKKEDRVLIIMGSAHTSFFKEFMSRSPKYQMVNTLEYLK